MLSGGNNILGQYYQYHINGTVITSMYPHVCRNFHMLIFLLSSHREGEENRCSDRLVSWSLTTVIDTVKLKSTRY